MPVLHPASQNLLNEHNGRQPVNFMWYEIAYLVSLQQLEWSSSVLRSSCTFAKQASTITIPQTLSMQDSQNAKKQFGPELYS